MAAIRASLQLTAPLTPGTRNEFHAGLQQAFGRVPGAGRRIHLEVYAPRLRFQRVWQYADHLPDRMGQSKIPGFAIRAQRAELPRFLGVCGDVHVAARFFTPQISGIGVTPTPGGSSVFRIDHDETFNADHAPAISTFGRTGPWIGFNWRYDSGLVAGAGAVRGRQLRQRAERRRYHRGCFGLTPDQQFEAGFSAAACTPRQPHLSVRPVCARRRNTARRHAADSRRRDGERRSQSAAGRRAQSVRSGHRA